jgi:asparagine synthase (glutamine-hydrolysing)
MSSHLLCIETGYTRYAVDLKRQGFARLPKFVRENLMKPVSERLPHGARGRNYLYNVALDPVDRYIDNISIVTGLNRGSLYSDDFLESLKQSRPANGMFRDYASRVATGEPIDRLLYLDSKTYLPGDILTKVDRMSMAVSLEARVPLLDHKLIEFVSRMPASLKMRGLESKYIFKRAIKDIVPDEILNRPKQGFGVPIGAWINDQLRERMYDTLHDPITRSRGYFRLEYIDLLLDEHRRGRRDHSHTLWTILIFELWCRIFLDSGTSVMAPNAGQSTQLQTGV